MERIRILNSTEPGAHSLPRLLLRTMVALRTVFSATLYCVVFYWLSGGCCEMPYCREVIRARWSCKQAWCCYLFTLSTCDVNVRHVSCGRVITSIRTYSGMLVHMCATQNMRHHTRISPQARFGTCLTLNWTRTLMYVDRSNDTFCRSLGCRFTTARHGSLMDHGIDWCGVQVQAEKVEFVSVDASTIDTNIEE